MATKLKSNPWFSMWIRPRQTIREIVSSNPRFRFGVLSILYGLPSIFHIAQNLSLGMQVSLPVIIIVSLVVALIFGLIALSVMSALLLWTGKWLGGAARYLDIRAAVSWANVTNIVPMCFWIVLIALCQQSVFLDTFMLALATSQAVLLLLPFLIFQFVVAIWSFIILFHALGEVQGFSAWKALLNVLIPFVLVIAGMWLLMGAVWWVQSMMGQ